MPKPKVTKVTKPVPHTLDFWILVGALATAKTQAQKEAIRRLIRESKGGR